MSLLTYLRSFRIVRVEPEKHYTPIVDAISLDVAIVQAATMLDEAGVKAIDDGSVDGMIAVAAGWMAFGQNMLGSQEGEDAEGEDEEEEVLSETSVLGFQSPENREVLESEKQESRSKARL